MTTDVAALGLMSWMSAVETRVGERGQKERKTKNNSSTQWVDMYAHKGSPIPVGTSVEGRDQY